jgi:hypothetical protein
MEDNVARMDEMRNVYLILVGNPHENVKIPVNVMA